VQTSAKAIPDNFQSLMGATSTSKGTSVISFHEDLTSFSSTDVSQTVEKCPKLQCWRIVQKNSWIQIQKQMTIT